MAELKKVNQSSNSYKIKKVFNNNVILAENNSSREEVVLVGKGLGFSAQQGEELEFDPAKVEKEFIPVKGEKKEKYEQLMEEVDKEVIGLTEEIIAMVGSKLDEKLDEHIHIALADHIGFTIKRLKNGMEITNPFLRETRTLYELEYDLAKEAVKMIEDRFEISIPEEEIGFITLHIHAARTERGISATVKYTSLIKEMIEIIEEEMGVELPYQSLNYARLITHLRFALERIRSNEEEVVNDNPLLNKIEVLDKIRDQFKTSYNIAKQLVEFMREELEVNVPDNEIGYIAIHLERLRRNLAKRHN